MSGPRIPDAAKSAAKEALRGYTGDCVCDEAYTSRRMVDPTCQHCDMEGVDDEILTAALPHIRRAVIEELVEKLTNTEPGPNWLGYKAWACDWLRAELEGDDRG